MAKYKVGDKVHWYDPKKVDPPFTIGKVSSTGITFKGENIEYPFKEIQRLMKSGNFILVENTTSQPDTIYLSGTPGQLEGFRQDWHAAGMYWDSESRKSLVVGVYFKDGCKPIAQYVGSPYELGASPVMENWQVLLDRAAKHVQQHSKAPIQLAGYDVELKEDTLHIGCRRILKKDALAAMEKLATLNLFLGEEGKNVTIPELLQIREWLSKK